MLIVAQGSRVAGGALINCVRFLCNRTPKSFSSFVFPPRHPFVFHYNAFDPFTLIVVVPYIFPTFIIGCGLPHLASWKRFGLLVVSGIQPFYLLVFSGFKFGACVGILDHICLLIRLTAGGELYEHTIGGSTRRHCSSPALPPSSVNQCSASPSPLFRNRRPKSWPFPHESSTYQ